MKKILFLFFITLIFLSNCAQNVRVKIDPEYNPEVRIVSDQDYPEIKSLEYLRNITIDGKNYSIELKDGKEVVKIPKKYLKNINHHNVKAAGKDLWNFYYMENVKILEVEPKHYKVPVTLLRQNPENYDKSRPFVREDLDSIDVLYRGSELTATRYLSEQGRPDQLELKIPTFSEVKMDDYRIRIDLPGYETYSQKLIDIQDKTLRLKLRQSMLKLKFENLDNNIFEPGILLMANKFGKVEKYSTSELKKGISVYDVEFPVKLYSAKKNISLYDNNGNKIDTLQIPRAGFFDLLFRENLREFPVVFYDLSTGKADPRNFEQWVNAKKQDCEGVFLYVTNGYEKVYNSNPDNIISVTNKIYRITPRTSNILESIKNFNDSFQQFSGEINLNDEERYGAKMTPRYYLFLSDENVDRLQFAVDKLVEQIRNSRIDKDKLIIFVNNTREKSATVKLLRNNNLNIQIL